MPASASSSSDWPLPATPATPTISPASHREGHPLHARDTEGVLDHEIRDLEHGLARRARRLVHAEADRAAHHQLGELGGRRLGRGQRRDDPP